MVFAMYQLESATCPPILDLLCTTLPTPSLWLSQSKSLFKKKKKVFIHFWLCWVFVAVWAFL